MRFTTRPEIAGTFGVATSTHWIASAVGMRILEAGGNAFDAAVAMGFTLNVVEPHLNGPLGEVPILACAAHQDNPVVICGQGVAPAAATIAHYRAEGLSEVPGSGLLAAVVPGAFDAWMILLRDFGTLPLRDVMEPAIGYAADGHPLLASAAGVIAGMAGFFAEEWPSSAAVWLPGGQAPQPGARFRNPDLAAFWTRLLAEAEAAHGREAQIEAARAAFYRGFVAETIGDFAQNTALRDATGRRRRGVLSAEDMARWQAGIEAPLSVAYRGWRVFKTGFWGQGPMLLQALRILEGFDVAALDPQGADFVHLVTETLKLVMADREAHYGDPDCADIPAGTLLSRAYAESRRALISDRASMEQRPGRLPGREALADRAVARASASSAPGDAAGTGEPTMAHLAERRGDTVHLDVIDRWGNIVSATPSGGWLQSSPVVPGLGVPLNTRAQMFWLDETSPSALAPGKRPRTTLTPSLAGPDGARPSLAFGTPGGDQQDQWQLILFLRIVDHGQNLQEAIDAPLFHTAHAQGSFWPRRARPGHLMAESRFGEAVLEELRGRGHRLEVAEPWSVGRLTAARREADGILKAAATPRLMQAYAVGR
ncbi:MAG: gamma-glutamyltransferase family protein [Alphaproteobacteria bacterium]|nr:MAG: gamma-glutamyltransferase family protein [Alphaproteobacteria bacterium]